MLAIIKTTFFSLVFTLTSLSLIAAAPAQLPSPPEKTSSEISSESKEELLKQKKNQSQKAPKEQALSEEQELQMILENSETLPENFESPELEDPSHTAEAPLTDTLYDPKMDYGKGAPVPTPSPTSTKKRSITAFFASVILAAVGMLVTAHNQGRSPTPGTPKCPT